jgi:PAS domain S-box-containing protein
MIEAADRHGSDTHRLGEWIGRALRGPGFVGMAIASPDRGCLDVNEELCSLLGYGRDELLNSKWSDLTHPDDLAAALAQFERVIAGESDGYALDKRWVRKDGGVLHTTTSVRCVRRADASVDYFVALVQDVTERKRAEERLRDAHEATERRVAERTEQLAAAIERLTREVADRKRVEDELRRTEAYLAEGQRLSHTGSWAWNARTGEAFLSREWLRILGLDPASPPALRTLVPERVHPDDRDEVRKAVDQALRTPGDFQLDYRIVRPEGGVRHIHSFAHPVLDPGGQLVEYVGTIMDTTERNEADAALQQARTELMHATRALSLGELTTSLAHEFNQPLAAIVTNGEAGLRWLAADPPNLKEARQAAGRIVRDANRASEILQRIRSLLKKSRTERSWLDPSPVVEEVLALIRPEAQRNRVPLEAHLASDLPKVLAARVEIQQVVLNLVMNGLEAMSETRGGAPTLEVRSERHEMDGRPGVLLSVEDAGPGVTEEDSDRIFEAFYSTKANGLGMGLPISRSIVETLGGRLWVAPRTGPGASFRCFLPSPP